jgi:hypothetical protein
LQQSQYGRVELVDGRNAQAMSEHVLARRERATEKRMLSTSKQVNRNLQVVTLDKTRREDTRSYVLDLGAMYSLSHTV